MARWHLGAAAVLLVAPGGLAGGQEMPAASLSPGAGSRLKAALVRLDKNGDGKLGRDEVGPMIAKHFDQLDKDRDNLLTAEELAGIRAFMGDAAGTGEGTAGRRGGGGDRGQRLQRRGANAEAGGQRGGRRFAGRAARQGRGGAEASGETAAVILAPGETLGAALAQQTAKMAGDLGLDGAAVIIVKGDGRGHYNDVARAYVGSYTPDTVVPVASTTKWFTAVTVATQVDAGKLSFDDPIARYIPDAPADKRAITVRQTLSHISGLDALSPMAERNFSGLKEAAANILSRPLVGQPGTVMKYSGTAMQVAGRAAEVAAGADFRTLFADKVAKPLSLSRTTYGGTGAPITGGGISTTPGDLERFTKMIAGHGRVDGVQVLSAKTFDDMTVLRTQAAALLNIPGPARSFAGMGTGMWCERADEAGKCQSVSSVGAFGTYAWVDLEHDEYGVMVVRTALNRAMPYWRGMRAAIDAHRGGGL